MDIDGAWGKTCKALLGDEIGELGRYRNYLAKYADSMEEKKSALSGKQVMVSSGEVCEGAKFISNDECAEYLSGARFALDVNEMKDADSVFGAVAGRLYYSGNLVLGNSEKVERSNRCINTFFVSESTSVYDSKYVAFSSSVRYGEYVFGSNWIGETQFAIRAFDTYKDVRHFETLRTGTSSDCYYTANLEGCSNCMFSFNLRNRSYMIGNVQLSREEYAKRKEKLLEDVRGIMAAKKSVPGIVEMIRD